MLFLYYHAKNKYLPYFNMLSINDDTLVNNPFIVGRILPYLYILPSTELYISYKIINTKMLPSKVNGPCSRNSRS
jgi:hypothetical protein